MPLPHRQPAKKTNGADIRIGMSVDQVAASRLGHQTKLASLEIGCDKGANAGNCDSGYSCAYSNNISGVLKQTAMPKEIDPKQIFDRLYGTPKNNDDRLSVLDAVRDDAKSLETKLGGLTAASWMSTSPPSVRWKAGSIATKRKTPRSSRHRRSPPASEGIQRAHEDAG